MLGILAAAVAFSLSRCSPSLAGLGGPFWFGAYTKLALILGASRAAPKRSAAAEGSDPPPPVASPPPGMRGALLEAFHAAVPTPSVVRGRALLGRDGRALG